MPSSDGSKTPLVSTSPGGGGAAVSFSMIAVGGNRPPRPITVGGGRLLPPLTIRNVGETSSVVVRLAGDAPPGLNSLTRPFTSTTSPRRTEGGELVNTKIASEVAGP